MGGYLTGKSVPIVFIVDSIDVLSVAKTPILRGFVEAVTKKIHQGNRELK